MRLTRRRLLASLALLGPAAAHANIAAPIRIAFLGIGHSHFKDKLRIIQQSRDFTLVGLCEDNPEIRKHGPSGARWISRQELLRDADAVVVEGDVRDLASDAWFALRGGKHVHIEKPPAATQHQFDRLLKESKSQDRVLQVGYMWRYHPGFNRAIEAASKGWLGEVFLVRATMNTHISDGQRAAWGRFRGGAMFEQGSHLVDVVVRLLGRPGKVTPFLQRRRSDPLADNTLAVLEYQRALAILTSAPLQPNAGSHRFLEICGTKGTLRIQPIEPPSMEIDLSAAAGPYSKGRQTIELPTYQRHLDEFVAFARAIRKEEELRPGLDLERTVHETLMRCCGERR